MEIDQTSNTDTIRLLEAYRDAAKRHGEAIESGDHMAAIGSADLISEVYAELRKRGADAQRTLLKLLKDPVAGVRLWSASHALEFSPEEGEPVLHQLVSTGSFLAFTAEITLREWRAGRLQFP